MRRLLLTPFGSADFRSLADRLLGMQNYRDIDPASPFSAAPASVGLPSLGIIVAIAVVVLRYRRPDLPRGFRTPWVPVVPAIGVVFSVWLISQLDLWSVNCRRAVSSSGSSDTEAERVAGAVRQVDHGVLGAGVLQ